MKLVEIEHAILAGGMAKLAVTKYVHGPYAGRLMSRRDLVQRAGDGSNQGFLTVARLGKDRGLLATSGQQSDSIRNGKVVFRYRIDHDDPFAGGTQGRDGLFQAGRECRPLRWFCMALVMCHQHHGVYATVLCETGQDIPVMLVTIVPRGRRTYCRRAGRRCGLQYPFLR